MSNTKRGAIFVAVEKKDLTIKNNNGVNVSTSSISIPKVCLAYSNEKKEVVMIGYYQSAPSIYVDEWGDRFKGLSIREVIEIIDPRGEKIKIDSVRGKYVHPNDIKLAQYLRLHPANKNVKHELNPLASKSFYELNFESEAKSRRVSDKEKTIAKSLVYESDFETKKAYCVAKNINVKDAYGAPLSDAELEDRLAWAAEQDPENFKREYNSGEIWNSYYIRTALERGYLTETDGGRVLLDSNGNTIKSAPVGINAISALAKGAATNNPKDSFAIDSIKEMIQGKKKTVTPTPSGNGNLLSRALDLGIIEALTEGRATTYLFEGKSYGSKTQVQGQIEKDDAFRNKLTKLVELEDDKASESSL